MNENLQPVGNEQLEARITAWVLGEASPFETAELEALCGENPELRIFHHRTLALHNLLKEAQASESDRSWKLPPSKREQLDSILGSPEVAQVIHKESRIRRASFRAVWGIAAILVLTFFTKRFLIIPGTVQKKELYFLMEEKSSAPQASMPATTEGKNESGEGEKYNAEISNRALEIAGNSSTKEMVIRREAPAAPSGQMGKAIASNTTSQAQIPIPGIAAMEPSTDFGDGAGFGGGFAGGEAKGSEGSDQGVEFKDGLAIVESSLRSGDKAITRNSIDAILNNPDRTAAAGKPAAPAAAASEPIAEAQRLRQFGKYDEARETLTRAAQAEGADEAKFKEEIAALEDPIRSNPALTQEGDAKVDDVRRNLYKADGNYELGKYDDAKKAYEDTLRIDPHNSAARRGMENLAAAKSDYYRAAYDHTRAELSMQVDSARELEVPAEERSPDLSPPPQAKAAARADQDVRADLLAQVERAWDLAVPADAAEKKKREAKEGADQFADSGASQEIGSVTARSGAARDISVIREFVHPTEYEPAEPRKDVGNLIIPNEHSPAFTGVWNSFESKDSDKSRYAWWVGDESQKASVKAGEHPSQSELLFADSAFNVNSTSGGWKVDLADHLTGFTGDLDGFVNYGTPIAGEPKQVDITTKHVEITQANDTELAFDWIVSPFNEKDAGLVFPVTPATPTGFESRLTGGTLEVAPILGDIPVVGRLFQEKQPIDLADLSQEIPAAQEPFSTFSLNISDASFQLALAAVEKGERPDPASIKPEQFYNAVDYGDPAPSSLEPVAAAIDQTAHPVIPGRNLVRVAIRTASTGRSAAQPLRLTLLVDQSGSMARADRRAAMDTALAQLATLLTENDRITVIGFSRTPRLIADSLPGNEAAKIPDLVNTTASEGGTNLEQAFNLSSELALRHKLDGAQNRIVLFTDGAANLGDADPDRLAGHVKELRQQGLAFDIAGIGTNDTNDRLLAELARHGNGRYYLVGENTGASLAAQLAGAFRPAAENVKVQVKLNPERVGSYKLIGFEKDRLKTEDFRDDSVDAAELAADEAGVAIYQVETLPEGNGEIGEVSVRFRDTASGEMVERAWTIPHDPSTPAFDKADPKTQLATLALLAAQKLQGGPLADAIRFSDHAETIANLKQAYANDAKAQRLLTLINALR